MMRDNTFVSLTSYRGNGKSEPRNRGVALAGPMTLVPAVTNPTTLFNTMVVALPVTGTLNDGAGDLASCSRFR